MRDSRLVALAGVLALAVAAQGTATVVSGQQAAEEGTPAAFPPRTPDGRPDFQGAWNGSGGAIFVDGSLGDRPRPNASASLVVDPPDGRIPYRSWALAQREEFWFEYIDPQAACVPPGVPRHLYNASRGYQVLQRPDRIVLANEWGHVYRVIPLDGRAHLPAGIRLFMGDSRGRWEGDTLVVDVTNFNGKSWLGVAGDFHSDALHVVERFTMVDINTIHYQATMTDPKVYTRPWTMAFPLRRDSSGEIWEEECHGGNVDFPTMRSLYKGYFGFPLTASTESRPRR